MITLADYVGVWAESPDWTPLCQREAVILLQRVNALITDYETKHALVPINPNTKTHISGLTYGGFRPQTCPIGAKQSAHKMGMAIDIYDPDNNLDKWLDRNSEALVTHNLYREASSATLSWCHLSTRQPKSKRRTFFP